MLILSSLIDQLTFSLFFNGSRQSTFINLARTIMAQEMDDTMQLSLLLEMVNAKCSGDDETFSVQEAQVYLKSLEELNIIMFVEGNIYRI